MSLPRLLLVDDSEAILAYERAALGDDYELLSAQRGTVALEILAEQTVDAVLLDLSMPEMDGDEVLRRLQADPMRRAIPVIIISSERVRGEACLAAGARAFLEKPLRADALCATVAGVLGAHASEQRARSVAVLPVEAGGVALGVPLDVVRGVVLQLETRPLPGQPPFLAEYAPLREAPMPVLDLPALLGKPHTRPLLDRKLVLLGGAFELFLCVDEVLDPALFGPEARLDRRQAAPLSGGTVQSALGELPLLETAVLLTEAQQRSLRAALAHAGAESGSR
jgi:CheY-like chemotaxis protein